ncbi:ABC transporter permease [uncultured Algibacter sp.]|uniref:ABC transporter permease n=1 Tax=uncultured Algibacter sp. TaxID=298659 RepID=UPI0026258D7C|nr:ABC transporter permease [uncultured Algibacter sp.]
MALTTRIYQKENNTKLFKLLLDSLKDIYGSRFLAKQLTVRDIKAQYRQSYLGILWAFLTPITTAGVWIFLNLTGTIRLSDTGVPYPVFAFSGTLLWAILIEAINSPTSSTKGAKGIMSKINFPKEALLISGIYKLLFNSSIKIVLLLIFFIIFGVEFHASILLFPLALLAIIIFGTSIGLFITPVAMLYSDVNRFLSMGFRMLMYITPVVYVIPKGGIMKTLMEYNPLTPLLLTTRDILLGQTPQFLTYYVIVILLSIPLLFLGLVVYRISIPIFVERLSA